MNQIFLLSFVLGLVFSNLFIYFQTNKKIQIYNENPPFTRLDYTNSSRLDFNSKLSHLFDKNPKTYWQKMKEVENWDLDLELKLTHTLKQNIFQPREFSVIELTTCGEDLSFWKWEIYLREAINVDKELRLPNDILILKQDFQTVEKTFKINLPKQELKPVNYYDPKEIYILGIRLKAKNLYSCLSEINLL